MQGSPKHKEFLDKLAQLLPFVFYGTVGVVAKLALYAKRGELSRGSLASCVILGYFSGYICAELCIYYNKLPLIPVLTPLAVVIGEAFMMWLLTNADKIFTQISDRILKK